MSLYYCVKVQVCFVAIVVRISGILSSLSLVFSLFNTASDNKLKINKNINIDFLVFIANCY